MLTNQEITDRINEQITPILTKYGATLTGIFPEAAAQTLQDGRIHTILTFSYKGEDFDLDGSQLRPKDIEFLLKHWDRIQEIYHHLDGQSDPFYSSISNWFKQEFDRRTLENNSLAFTYICNKIQKSGRRVWS